MDNSTTGSQLSQDNTNIDDTKTRTPSVLSTLVTRTENVFQANKEQKEVCPDFDLSSLELSIYDPDDLDAEMVHLIKIYGEVFVYYRFEKNMHNRLLKVMDWIHKKKILGHSTHINKISCYKNFKKTKVEGTHDIMYCCNALERQSWFDLARQEFLPTDGWKNTRYFTAQLLSLRDSASDTSNIPDLGLEHWPMAWETFMQFRQAVDDGTVKEEILEQHMPELMKLLNFESDESATVLHVVASANAKCALDALCWIYRKNRNVYHVNRRLRVLNILRNGTESTGAKKKSSTFDYNNDDDNDDDNNNNKNVRRSTLRSKSEALDLEEYFQESILDNFDWKEKVVDQIMLCTRQWNANMQQILLQYIQRALLDIEINPSELSTALLLNILCEKVVPITNAEYKCSCKLSRKHIIGRNYCMNCLRSDIAFITQADMYGRSMLHMAIQHGCTDMILYVFDEFFQDVQRKNYPDDDAFKTAHFEYKKGLLLSTTVAGETPLHFAARYEQPIIIFRLMNYVDEIPSIYFGNFRDDAEANKKDKPSYQQSLSSRPSLSRSMESVENDILQHATVKSHSNLYPNYFKNITESSVLVNGYLKKCFCRAPRPYVECCGKKIPTKWDDRTASNNATPGLRDRLLELLPDDLKRIVSSKLNRSQYIYLHMRDRFGQTPLHIASKMDRDSSAAVLLGLGADPAARDINRLTCLHHMVVNIPSLAAVALDQFTIVDRSSRSQYDFVSFLIPQRQHDRIIVQRMLAQANEQSQKEQKQHVGECAGKWWWFDFSKEQYSEYFWPMQSENFTLKKMYKHFGDELPNDDVEFPVQDNKDTQLSTLDLIVQNNRLNIISKRAFQVTISLYWTKFGFQKWMYSLLIYFAFLTIWTLNIMLASEDKRGDYTPVRIAVECVSACFVVYYCHNEIREAHKSKKFQKKAQISSNKRMIEDMQYISETWPDFYYMATHEETHANSYFTNKWNILDLLVYIFLLVGETMQVLGAIIDNKHTLYFAIRILLCGLLFAWLNLLKFGRSFESVGPFVVMLGDMLVDTGKFLFLFIIVFVPVTVAFVTLFSDAETEDGYFPYSGIFRASFSVFRITMVDYDYAILREIDEITAAIMVFLWLFFSALVFLNLFIAMMANTFQTIADNAARISAMERAATIVAMIRDMTFSEANNYRLDMLSDLEDIGDGLERLLAQFYDDPDDEESSLANIRLELLKAVNRQQESLFTIEQSLIVLSESERRTRKALRDLNMEVKAMKQNRA